MTDPPCLPSITTNETSEHRPTSGNNDVISLEELMYSSSSYHAIVKPVTTTMILAALAVTYVTTPSNKRAMEESMRRSYTVFDTSDNDSTGGHHSGARNLGLSLVNGLIIVSVIATLTFGIVLLYKYRCMKCLVGYMIISSASLLGFLGGLMFDVFIERNKITIDWISFIFIILNFAVVGTMSIFYQKGIPMFVTQSYLVFTSVILAWQLSHFDSWTAWTLLVLLALYDLCAVLTPCGPLKFLVNLMSKDDAPDMPGLLYEAQLPAGVERPGRQIRGNTPDQNNSGSREGWRAEDSAATGGAGDRGSVELDTSSTNGRLDSEPQPSPSVVTRLLSNNADNADEKVMLSQPPSPGALHTSEQPITALEENTHDNLPTIPLAIALIYRLDILSPECYATAHQSNPLSRQGLSSSQLRAHVEVRFPPRGGKIVPSQDIVGSSTASRSESPERRNGNRIEMELKYIVLDRHGNLKRTLVVDEEGRVFQETEEEGNSNTSGEHNSIKLGLGDFIFYSLLVAKASEYSFATFAACTLVILAGLGSTLILLSVYHQALPALPISIFLGVIFYLLTRVSIEPWIEAIMVIPIYV